MKRDRTELPGMEPERNEMRSDIVELTQLLRSDGGAYWSNLRALVTERDIDPNSALVAEKWPDEDSDFLLLVLDDGRAIEIEYADAMPDGGPGPSLSTWSTVAEGSPDWEVYGRRVEEARAFFGEHHGES